MVSVEMENRVGVVILNYMSWKLTIQCIADIRQSDKERYYIVIVDNDSPNQSYEKLYEAYKGDESVICIAADRNGGYAYGNNIGIRECQNKGIKYAIIMNNDIIFRENSINELIATLKNNVNTVVSSPKIFDANGNIGGRQFVGKPTIFQFAGLLSQTRLHLDLDNTNCEKKVYSVPCCCIAVDVDKFIAMGAFDEGTFMYCEEGTMSAQAWRAGYDIVYNPSAMVVHNHVNVGGKNSYFTEKNMAISAVYFWNTYMSKSKLETIFLKIIFSLRISMKRLLGKLS